MKSQNRSALVILAGGEGRRLGGPKARLLLDGEPILRAMLRRLAWRAGPTVLSVSPQLQDVPGYECFDQTLIDESPGASPAELLRRLAVRLGSTTAVYVPVDMPLFSRERLEELLGSLDPSGAVAAMFRRRGEIESLPLAATPQIISVFDQTIASGDRSLHVLGTRREVLVLDTDDSDDLGWIHLNDADDVARSALRIGRAPL